MAQAVRFVHFTAAVGTEDRLRAAVESNLLTGEQPAGLLEVALLEDFVDARRLVLMSRFASLTSLEANTEALQTGLKFLKDDLGADAAISSYLVVFESVT